MLSNGTIFASYRDYNDYDKTGICYSTDNGKTWEKSSYLVDGTNTNNNDEYDFSLLDANTVLCVGRTDSGPIVTLSTDGGKTFTAQKALPLGNEKANRGPAVIRCSDGNVEIYTISRFTTGALLCTYISTKDVKNWLVNNAEFKGMTVRVASLGLNGNNDQGYPEIVTLADGTVKCFFYQKAIDGASKASFYCIDGEIKHFAKYQVRENVVEPSCTSQGECDVVTYCTDCNRELKREHIILDKISHSFDKSIAPATFNSTGFTINSCKNCGYTYINNYKQQIGTVALSKIKYTYNGKAYKPVVSVKDINGDSIAAKNYTVAYSDTRKNVGKYKVTIKFKGEYSGSKNLYFTIVPKGTNLTKVSSNKNGFELKWKMQKDSVTGYQVQYSTSKSLKNAKTLNVGKNSITTKKITGLKNKKRYYVRIRTFKIVNGTRYYSTWNGTKSVLTK